MLTAEQRYRQAIQKARILARRNLKIFMSGRADVLECSGDIERRCIVQEIAHAYDIGKHEVRP